MKIGHVKIILLFLDSPVKLENDTNGMAGE